MFLITFVSGQRCSLIHALSVHPGHLRWEFSGVKLIPSTYLLAKNQTESSGLIEFLYRLFPLTRRFWKTNYGVRFGHSNGIWSVHTFSAPIILLLLPLLLPIALHLRIRFRDGLFRPSRAQELTLWSLALFEHMTLGP